MSQYKPQVLAEAYAMNLVLEVTDQRAAAEEPRLRQIKGGWAASGRGWAVHGVTQEEAVQKFQTAIERHTVIAARPYWYEAIQSLMRPE